MGLEISARVEQAESFRSLGMKRGAAKVN